MIWVMQVKTGTMPRSDEAPCIDIFGPVTKTKVRRYLYYTTRYEETDQCAFSVDFFDWFCASIVYADSYG